MKDMVKKAGLEKAFYIESAATSTEEIGNPVYPPARKKLAEHGISCAGKTARQLRSRDYAEYDLLIGMDQANLRNMRRICGGDPEGKLRLLMDFTDRPADVADPWYTNDFEATWRDNKAVREGLLTANPMKSLDRKEKFQPSPEDREFLTIEELRSLMALPCSNEQVKKAFVFSCFTGLRLSDARTLTWRKVYKTPDGKTLYIHVFMQKTQKPNNIPLSQEALNCLQAKDDLDEPIFTLPASDATINYHVKKLVKAAGIEKKVSFHCSRHTFATMMLTLGVDIYTTSKLLGHANVTTTAIYAKIVDKKKVDAMNLVNDLFTKDDNTENYEDRTTQPQA